MTFSFSVGTRVTVISPLQAGMYNTLYVNEYMVALAGKEVEIVRVWWSDRNGFIYRIAEDGERFHWTNDVFVETPPQELNNSWVLTPEFVMLMYVTLDLRPPPRPLLRAEAIINIFSRVFGGDEGDYSADFAMRFFHPEYLLGFVEGYRGRSSEDNTHERAVGRMHGISTADYLSGHDYNI